MTNKADRGVEDALEALNDIDARQLAHSQDEAAQKHPEPVLTAHERPQPIKRPLAMCRLFHCDLREDLGHLLLYKIRAVIVVSMEIL